MSLLRKLKKLCYCLTDETALLKSRYTYFTDPMSVSRQMNMKQVSINTRQGTHMQETTDKTNKISGTDLGCERKNFMRIKSVINKISLYFNIKI